MAWEVIFSTEMTTWLDQINQGTYEQVIAATKVLEDLGPALGRPLLDSIKGSQMSNLKELRPGSTGSTEIRILFAFDPTRRAVMLLAGDKAGDWSNWYKRNIPLAESIYTEHLERLET